MTAHDRYAIGLAKIGGLLLLAAPACGPQKGASTGGEETDTSGGGSDATATGSGGSSGGSTSGSSGGSSGTSSGTSTSASSGEATDTDAPTTGVMPMPCSAEACVADVCDLEACACALMPEGLEYVDCGFLRWDQPTEDWQAGQDCVLAAVGQGQSFKILFHKPSIDSLRAGAFVGIAGDGYSVRSMEYDTWGQHVAEVKTCAAVLAIDDCVIEPESICLACDNPDEPTVLCDVGA